MHASGYLINSPERKDRCARVAASVAYKLVEELNKWRRANTAKTSHGLHQEKCASQHNSTAQNVTVQKFQNHLHRLKNSKGAVKRLH
ncbi:hypothetical protein [Desulfurella amilsii]|uniref:hypothetical protein n=1 Tax=Desulfurella amilsii TaxID=1562698 RepID=UPI000A31E6C3|nr:hypothetical protein [Desulfurella amilsii]